MNKIGKDCEDLIYDYVNQLVLTEKYNKVIEEMKNIKKNTYVYQKTEMYNYLSSNTLMIIKENKISKYVFEDNDKYFVMDNFFF